MSRAKMSPRAKRAWAIGLVIFFVVMCGAIGLSELWAVNVNVPRYEHKGSL